MLLQAINLINICISDLTKQVVWWVNHLKAFHNKINK